ncbi:MAG: YggU family protein [Proteobacteria bacterium]|nr:YggU family protein [Pseudomonadota bacterium]
MDEGKWISEKDSFIYIKTYIQPRASRNEIVGIYNDALKIRLTSPPVEGAANELLTKFIAKYLGLPKSGVEIVSGDKSRHKIIKVQDISMAKICNIFGKR